MPSAFIRFYQRLESFISRYPTRRPRASQRVDVSGAQETLEEGRDYYLEGDAMVFTASYLERRGYCCDSGCRHCPYEKR